MQSHTTAAPPLGLSPEAIIPKEGDQLFQTVFIKGSDAMLVLDGRRRIVEANPAVCRLLRLSGEELTGRILDDLLSDETGDLAGVWNMLLKAGTVKRRHGIAPRGQGRRAVECSYGTLLDADRYLCVVRDTTDRQLLEARLAQSEKMNSLGRLAGGIAHDLNNLLTAVLGYTELLLEGRGADAQDRGDLEQIQQAGQRAAALTQQLMAYSRKQVLGPRQVDLNHTVTSLRSMLTRLIREDISVICQPSPRPALLHIDPTELEQIIVNLVLNARDAIAAEGTIRIAVARVPAAAVRIPPDSWDPLSAANPVNLVNPVNPVNPVREYIHLSVSDDGVGIPSEGLAHLFEPVFTTKDPWRRTGPGLASVYGIVRQSQGFIDVESEIGGCTTFSMYFPAAESIAADEAPPAHVEPFTARETHRTILLVEDEDGVRRIVSAMLRRRGYRVLEASTPRAACELFAEHADAVDLLLTDVVMPEMNGPGLAQRLVALKPSLRIVFMSGYADVTPPHDRDNPNVSFLSKPFQASVLLTKVQAVLTRPGVKS